MLPIRVATWNIHGSIGADGQCLPDRIARAVKAMEADVVALQEIDGRTRLGRSAEAFETFAALLGGNIVEARLVGPPGEEHGNLLWSRWPIVRSVVHLLPGGMEQRGLIEGEIALPDGPLRVFATHFALSPITRWAQSRETAGHVRAGQGPAILMGDFNQWRRSGGLHRRFSELLPNSLRPATFPARRPVASLDRLYASAGVTLREVEAPVEAAGASDHLPIVAELTFQPL